MKINKVSYLGADLVLTNKIDCPWCDAKSGEPCKIQVSTDELMKMPRIKYHLGNDKTYFPEGERIHLGRHIEKCDHDWHIPDFGDDIDNEQFATCNKCHEFKD